MSSNSKKSISVDTKQNSPENRLKKARIDINSLKSHDSIRRLYVGELLNVAFEQPIVEKKLLDVFIKAVVVQFKFGRLMLSYEPGAPFAFLVIADATGVVTIGCNIAQSGLENFMKDQNAVSEDSRCFFPTIITGTIKISPSGGDSSVPLLSFRGKFDELHASTVNVLSIYEDHHDIQDRLVSLVYPTSDVLDQIREDDYSTSSKHTIPLIAGKVDHLLVHEERKKLFIAMHDPTGPILLEIYNLFGVEYVVNSKGLATDKHMVAVGELHICRIELDGTTYTRVRMDYTKVDNQISLLSFDEFKAFNDALCALPQSCFSGVHPTST